MIPEPEPWVEVELEGQVASSAWAVSRNVSEGEDGDRKRYVREMETRAVVAMMRDVVGRCFLMGGTDLRLE